MDVIDHLQEASAHIEEAVTLLSNLPDFQQFTGQQDEVDGLRRAAQEVRDIRHRLQDL